jgi:hypothetical protein
MVYMYKPKVSVSKDINIKIEVNFKQEFKYIVNRTLLPIYDNEIPVCKIITRDN